jgi:hypothetical protein
MNASIYLGTSIPIFIGVYDVDDSITAGFGIEC